MTLGSPASVEIRTLVKRAHDANLFVRMWTVNGHTPGSEAESRWSAGYTVGGFDAALTRWRAAIHAGVDFVATHQYEAFVSVLGSSASAC
jgi:glycerophosphoryl diester phosphodiesterase